MELEHAPEILIHGLANSHISGPESFILGLLAAGGNLALASTLLAVSPQTARALTASALEHLIGPAIPIGYYEDIVLARAHSALLQKS